MFEATNYISEYNVGDKFISFQYTNGKRFAQINVCQNKKVERNKKKIEVYQEGKAPLSLSFSTEDEAIEAFDLLNTTLDTLRTNCQTANAVVTLFPNGQEIVTESRDFRDSDIDKLLIIVGNDITLTMPDSIVFSEQLRTIGLKFLQGYTGCGYQPSHGFTTKVLQLPNDAEFITLITGEYLGKSSVGSIANMQVNSDSGIVTLNKYLYDKVSASGGGSSTLFPNGIKYIVTGDAPEVPVPNTVYLGDGIFEYELQAGDAGKLIIIKSSDITTYLPELTPFQINENVGITSMSGVVNVKVQFAIEDDPIEMLSGAGNGCPINETVIFTNKIIDGENKIIPLSTIAIDKKTALKYLYDKVNASGGGASSLFPNGYEIVETSRDFLITDKGKVLFLGEGVTVTLPDSPTIFTTGDIVGIYAGSSTSSYNRGNGANTFPYRENDESELVVLTYLDGDFTEVSSFHVDDNGIRKTALKYLYDKVQNIGSLLFPNGAKLVETDRTLQADDAGYALLLSDGVQLTIPTICPLSPGQYFGISTNSATASFILEGNPSELAVYLSYAGQEAALINEVVTYVAADVGGSTSLILLTQIAGSNDTIMTANRYFFEQLQNVIPLSGTEVGKPVTGDIEIEFEGDRNILSHSSDFTFSAGISFGSGILGLNSVRPSGSFSMQLNDNGEGNLLISSSDRGIVGSDDYTANITDLDYTQKIYVDKSNSYSTTEIKTGGTWIDGKPIYRKTFTGIINSVIQTIPFDNTDIIIRKIETLFSDINNDGVGTFNSFFAFTDSDNYIDIRAYYLQDDSDFIIINRTANAGVITPSFTNAEIYITIEYTKTTD